MARMKGNSGVRAGGGAAAAGAHAREESPRTAGVGSVAGRAVHVPPWPPTPLAFWITRLKACAAHSASSADGA